MFSELDWPIRPVEVRVDQAPKTIDRDVEIINKQGLHARPVMRFVDLASQYKADLTVDKCGRQVDGRSPMDMMTLEAPQGTQLRLSATGDDAEELINALAMLIADRFGEE